MKYFSVPADFKIETIDQYVKLGEKYADSKVIETYGQITVGNEFASGRSLELLPNVDIMDLAKYVEYSQSRGIVFNYTINAPHMMNKEFTQEGIKKITKFLKVLYSAGVMSLTICTPSLIDIVQAMNLDFKIKLSTIADVSNVNKAVSYNDMGFERIVVSESINRDFSKLKRIREAYFGDIEVIANSICHIDCPNRMFHYNQAAVDSIKISGDESTNYYTHRCMLKRYEKISSVLKLSWIRPEDIKYYVDIGINYFKLQGRQLVLKGDPVRTLEAYFSEKFDGNLMELLEMFAQLNSFGIYIDNKSLEGFIKQFYEKNIVCNHDCIKCGYCDRFAEKNINKENYIEVRNLANKFYNEFDQFMSLVTHVVNEDNEVDEEEIDIEFDF